MFVRVDLEKTWQVIARPFAFFEREQTVKGYWPVLRFYLLLNIILALLTPVVNWFGVPSNIVHAGTNAQMGAYVWAPVLEAATGVSRLLWVAVLTYVGNALRFPMLGLLFHAFARLLRGSGALLASFKVSVYSTAPMLLLGWIPYFGLISGLWVGYLYVVALNRLHDIGWGPAIAFINVLIGVQLVWAFTFGWIGSSVPW
jgi:hypothetical protein